MMLNHLRWILLLVPALALLLAACGGDTDNAAESVSTSTPAETVATDTTMHQGHSMASPEAGEDADLHFIDAMIVHHQSAVAMAEAVKDSAEHQEIRDVATAIIAAQEREIEQMRNWRDAWFPSAPESDLSAMMDMPGMNMSDADMEMLAQSDAPDEMFIDMMVPHHESAIDMAKEIQQTTERSELRQLAAEIITAQQTEIDQLKEWRAEWFGE